MLIENVKGLKEIFSEKQCIQLAHEEINTIEVIAGYVKEMRENTHLMTEARKKYNNEEDIVKRAVGYSAEVRPYIKRIRYCIDKLELIIEDRLWPLPKYRELLTIQ